jgi:hypothetical protein
LTVPLCTDGVSIDTPFDSDCRTTSPTAVTLSESVRVEPLERNKLPFVCTRPPKLKLGPAKKLRSTSENVPN